MSATRSPIQAILAAALAAGASAACAGEAVCAVAGLEDASTWRVDVEATTPSDSAFPSGVYVLFDPGSDGCWRIVTASFSRIPGRGQGQELLILDTRRRFAVVAYENRGSQAWCHDDPAKNRPGYNPCFSSLVERKPSARWLGSLLTGGSKAPGDNLVGVSADRVRHLLASVPNLQVALEQATGEAKARLDAQQSRAASDREAAEREQQVALMGQREAELHTRRDQLEREQERAKAAWAKLQHDAVQWRRTLGEGIDTHCGMLIEKKQSIAKIQTIVGEHWLRIDQLYPASAVACRFVNGRYVDPVAP
jgi:hypothetical protein